MLALSKAVIVFILKKIFSYYHRKNAPPPCKHLDIEVGNRNAPMSRWLVAGGCFPVYDSTNFGHPDEFA